MTEPTLPDLRRQWHELQARHDSGALDAEAHAAARAALEQRIVAAALAEPDATPSEAGAAAPQAGADAAVGPAAPPSAAASAPVARASLRFWAAAVPFALVVAFIGYGWKGQPRAVGTPPPGFVEQQQQAGAPQRTGAEQIDALVKQLQQRLEQQPGDIEGWSLLARSQMSLGRHDEAAAAYRKALALKPDDASLLTDYADALGVLNGRTLEGEPARLLEQALKLDPKHLKALVLAGTLEYQRGNYGGAAKRWQEVVDIGPAGDGLVELAREGVVQAQRRQAGGASAPAVGAAPPATARVAQGGAPAQAARPAPGAQPGQVTQAAAATPGAAITGTVRLAAALKAQASPDDVVFIFARATGNGAAGMPLAIVRKRVADLPAAFTLDDSQAMSPAARLSSAQQVVVTARVSKSGQATPQPGDLEGVSAAVKPGAREVVVEIGSVRK